MTVAERPVALDLRLRPGEDRPEGEIVWASPVDVDDGGGFYRLRRTSFAVPLAAGDLVEARLNGNGLPQVVDVVLAGAGVLTWFEPHAPDGPAVDALVQRWEAEGAGSTQRDATRVTAVWPAAMDVGAVGEAFVRSRSAAEGVWVAAFEPRDRTRGALDAVDFELDTERRTRPVETDYWAADDPWWADHGFGDPEFLAFIQRLAGEHARVARALERGQHEKVMMFVIVLSSPDPGSVRVPQELRFDD